MTIIVGHFLAVLTHTLGEFAEVSASGAVRIASSVLVDTDGEPIGGTIQKTAHDQVALSGVLKSKDDGHGTFVNLHCRAAIPLSGEYGKGRTLLKWIIDGEYGTVEVQNREEDGPWGALITMAEHRVLLNGEEVDITPTEADRLGAPGKGWLEFAKGQDGLYWGLDESVKLHQVLDAALTSIQEGRRISLV